MRVRAVGRFVMVVVANSFRATRVAVYMSRAERGKLGSVSRNEASSLARFGARRAVSEARNRRARNCDRQFNDGRPDAPRPSGYASRPRRAFSARIARLFSRTRRRLLADDIRTIHESCRRHRRPFATDTGGIVSTKQRVDVDKGANSFRQCVDNRWYTILLVHYVWSFFI